MVFSSLVFIFRFMPIAFLLYFLTPKKYKNLTILVASLFFYSWGEAKYLILMLFSIVIDYGCSILIYKYRERKRIKASILIFSMGYNLGMLFLFKYMNFFILNFNEIFNMSLNLVKLTLPLGISFYTFQTMSYTIDVYRGKISPEKNIINFGAFVCLFPQLIAGPIVKYTDIQKELKDREVKGEDLNIGIEKFIIGLAQKVLIANNIGLLWSEIEAIGFENINMPIAWIGIIAFSLQIYFDFSGYSLMAIGLGRMMGFNFPKNFDYPYISKSISEFWRRWHITLGNFFKEYVYIPLGGNRVGKKRGIFNLLMVWALTGFWHGAEYNFILWGIYFFILISLEKIILLKYLEKNKVIAHIYTLISILIGFTIFSIVDLNSLGMYLKKMIDFSFDFSFIYYLRNYIVILLVGIICATPYPKKMYMKYVKNDIIKTFIMMIIFIFSVAYLVDSTYNPFMYFRF